MALQPLKLPRLPLTVALFDPATGKPNATFQRYWQSFAEAIERSVNGVISAQNAAAAAQATADEAEAKADQALAGDGSMNAATSLKLSYPVGVTITGIDNGPDTGVLIGAHTRRYGNGDEVSVGAGALGAIPFSTEVIIYYDDASRAGGAVTYQSTTVLADAKSSDANPNRHYVGYVTTPASGDPPTDGVPAENS